LRKTLASCDQQQVLYVFVLQRDLQINWLETSCPITWH